LAKINKESKALHDWLRSRHSVRVFTDQPIPEDQLRRILETATHAPNAHNAQPWRFVVLVPGPRRETLAEVMAAQFRLALQAEPLAEAAIQARLDQSRQRILAAPALILLFSDPSVMKAYADPDRQAGERVMAAQGVTLAGGTALLAAHAEGLAGVWVCWPMFTSLEIAAAFDLPAHWECQGMLFLGHPAAASSPRPRRPLNDVLTILE
jgi:F420 biosynthesis protein FbiB-like protein